MPGVRTLADRKRRDAARHAQLAISLGENAAGNKLVAVPSHFSFVGTNGAIKGSLSAADAEIKGLLSESAVIKGFLHLRSTGRVAGKISCGDLEVERGAGNSPEPHAAAGGSAEGAVAQAMPEIPSGLEAPNGANGSAAASL